MIYSYAFFVFISIYETKRPQKSYCIKILMCLKIGYG